MVGEGVLISCLENNQVNEVLMVNRKPSAITHPKLKELLVPNFRHTGNFNPQLSGYDACFFCAGISSVGLNEEKYTEITYNTTIDFATKLASLNSQMVFNYVSGAHTDGTETSKIMWARVKGKTENDLLKLPFKAVYNFRPGAMKPYQQQQNVRWFFKPLIAIMSVVVPSKVLTLKQVGKAMVNAVIKGYGRNVLEVEDIAALANK